MNLLVRPSHPGITATEEGNIIDKQFRSWFYNHVDSATVPISNLNMMSISKGPSRVARACTGYDVNGYKFQTIVHSVNRATNNSGVYIKGQVFGTAVEAYFRVINEIIELKFGGWTVKHIIIFNCTWFKTIRRGGLRVLPKLKIVEVKKTKHMCTRDMFVLAP